ncbi:MAG: hypothetical protein R2800_12195 [Flavipsychrobacter sp.]
MEKQIKKIIIPSKLSIHSAIADLALGFVLIYLSYLLFNVYCILGFLMFIVVIRTSIYQMIDLWFTKTIIIEGDELFICCWGIKFKLSREDSFLKIDNIVKFSSLNVRYPSLNIYRNPTSFLHKVFKNKIKLNVTIKKDIKETEEEARRISNMFGIPFKDTYKYDEHAW